jgi:hypothetical protein
MAKGRTTSNIIVSQGISDYENGLRILARWIARAYLADMEKESKAKLQNNIEDIGTSIGAYDVPTKCASNILGEIYESE